MVWKGMMSYTPEQANLVRNSKVTMEKYLVKPGLASGFVPDFAVGCRRTTPVSSSTYVAMYRLVVDNESRAYLL